MSGEVTTKEYWDKYWGKGEAKFSSYNLSQGKYYAYKLLLDDCFAKVRARTSRQHLKVIDCGCGEGQILRFISEQFEDVEVWGIEYSDAIEKARSMGDQLGLPFNLIHGDLFDEWPEDQSASFDAVLSFGLIEHFERPNDVIKQMSKALAPGGAMVTVIPSFEGLFHFLWKFYDRDNYAYHIPVTFMQLGELHSDAGLEDVSTYRLGVPTIPGIHNASAAWEKGLQKVIRNLNGRILRKFYRRQQSLDRQYLMVPNVAGVGFKSIEPK